MDIIKPNQETNPKKVEKNLKGLGGWLKFIGFGLILLPIREIFSLWTIFLPLFSDGTWEAVTTVGSEYYEPLWGPIIVGEMFYSIFMAGAAIYLARLFYQKHYIFPKYFMIFIGIPVIINLLDAWLVSIVMPGEPMFDSETTKDYIRAVSAAIGWIPYMMLSKRVKLTFVEHKPDDYDPDHNLNLHNQ